MTSYAADNDPVVDAVPIPLLTVHPKADVPSRCFICADQAKTCEHATEAEAVS